MDEWTAIFRNAAASYGRAIEDGDKDAATAAAREGRAARDEILARDDVTILMGFLNDESPWVRYAAASSILEADAELALPVLDDLQSRRGVIGAVAFTAIQMWKTK